MERGISGSMSSSLGLRHSLWQAAVVQTGAMATYRHWEDFFNVSTAIVSLGVQIKLVAAEGGLDRCCCAGRRGTAVAIGGVAPPLTCA